MPEHVDSSSSNESALAQGHAALLEEAALVESRSADWLRLTGADRLRFANGLVSCDLRSLLPGQGAYGFFTDPKGKIISDAAFLASDSELWIELPRGRGTAIAGHMGKYVVADQVEIEELEHCSMCAVAGPEAGGKLAEVLGEPLDGTDWSGMVVETRGGRLLIRSDRRLGVPAWALGGSGESVTSVLDALKRAGARSVHAAALAAVRIEKGVPWFGLDFGPDIGGESSFPQETGIEDWAVSYEKGCYLGQEVVARIHFRGKVNRSLRGLVFPAGSGPASGIELTWSDEVVGVMNSVAYSPAARRPIGLAIVHHKAEPGSELSTPAGPCRLVELPFGAQGLLERGR
ncbi:MAG: folate-binding protein YgfZ [bacterium]|nr:folate-binding protein YgfZ [bacterium]